ncbi:hypothetical protein bcgnr5384_48890 [Bacillus cereus]
MLQPAIIDSVSAEVNIKAFFIMLHFSLCFNLIIISITRFLNVDSMFFIMSPNQELRVFLVKNVIQ